MKAHNTHRTREEVGIEIKKPDTQLGVMVKERVARKPVDMVTP